MKRRQLESRILIIIAVILLVLLYLVSASTVKSLLPLFSTVLFLLPSKIDSLLQPLTEETHAEVKECLSGDYENCYMLIESELIPVEIRASLYMRGLIDSIRHHKMLYPSQLIKAIKVLPTAHKKDMLPETLIKSDYKQDEVIRIGTLLIQES